MIIHLYLAYVWFREVHFLGPQTEALFADAKVSANSCGTPGRPSFLAPNMVSILVPDLGSELWFAAGHVCMRKVFLNVSLGVVAAAFPGTSVGSLFQRSCLLVKLWTQNKDALMHEDENESTFCPVRVLRAVMLALTVQPLQHRATSKQSLCLPLFVQKSPAHSIILKHSLAPACITFVLCNKQSPAPARKILNGILHRSLPVQRSIHCLIKKILFALCARATQHRHRGCFVSLNSVVLC